MSLDLVSAGIGAVLWEFCKQLFGAVIKRLGDKRAAKRTRMSEHCDAARSSVELCLQQAVEYLTADCTDERKKELGRAIRHELSILGQSIKDLNTYAAELQVTATSNSLLIAFRQAITWHLDSKSYRPQTHSSADVVRAYAAGFALQDALTRTQISAM